MVWKFKFLIVLTDIVFHDTADAHLRIVSERVDIIDNLIISVSVPSDKTTMYSFHLLIFSSFLWFTVFLFQIGPPNSIFIKSLDKSAWTAKDVADSVLADKSALVTFR